MDGGKFGVVSVGFGDGGMDGSVFYIVLYQTGF